EIKNVMKNIGAQVDFLLNLQSNSAKADQLHTHERKLSNWDYEIQIKHIGIDEIAESFIESMHAAITIGKCGMVLIPTKIHYPIKSASESFAYFIQSPFCLAKFSTEGKELSELGDYGLMTYSMDVRFLQTTFELLKMVERKYPDKDKAGNELVMNKQKKADM